jgi:hypothetical protein
MNESVRRVGIGALVLCGALSVAGHAVASGRESRHELGAAAAVRPGQPGGSPSGHFPTFVRIPRGPGRREILAIRPPTEARQIRTSLEENTHVGIAAPPAVSSSAVAAPEHTRLSPSHPMVSRSGTTAARVAVTAPASEPGPTIVAAAVPPASPGFESRTIGVSQRGIVNVSVIESGPPVDSVSGASTKPRTTR